MNTRTSVRWLRAWAVRGALRSRWFQTTGVVFLIGGLLLLLFSGDALVLGQRGVGRALAGLAHLAMFLVPVMALVPAAEAIAAERESGDLDFVLAQPVRRAELYRERWLGLAVSTVASLLIVYGLLATVATARGFATARVAVLFLLTALLGLAFLSIGLCVSALVSTRTRALTTGLAVWFVLLALGTLGVVGIFARWGLPLSVVRTWVLFDPIEAFRLASLTLFEGDADLLGPIGVTLQDRLGSTGIVVVVLGILAGWSVAAFVAGRRIFDRYQAS